MQRFLFRIEYSFSDGSKAYEPMCVRAADGDEVSARAEVDAATNRYPQAVGATKTITLTLVTADV